MQWVKGHITAAVVKVTAVAQIHSLARELPYAIGEAIKFFFLSFLFLPFLGLLPRHMEVLRLGVQSEL